MDSRETSALRPQSVLFGLLGDHVVGQGLLVSSASVIEVMGRVGFAEAAVRATLARMVKRDLLERRQVRRAAFFCATPRAEVIIRDGAKRVHKTDVVGADEQPWTTVLFTMPESHQSQRHTLRSRLVWAGFGPLRGGAWIAPREIDIIQLLDGLGLDGFVRSFVGFPVPPTQPSALIEEAYDLDRLASGYEAFIARWSGLGPATPSDALARRLVLAAEWLQAVRHDPLLPAPLLPADWQARTAQSRFRNLWQELSPAAEQEAQQILETIPI